MGSGDERRRRPFPTFVVADGEARFAGSTIGHWPEDGQAVALCCGDEFLQIGFLRLGGRRAFRGLTHLADKFRERAAAGHEQHAGGLRALNAEAVGDSARTERVIAGAQGD